MKYLHKNKTDNTIDRIIAENDYKFREPSKNMMNEMADGKTRLNENS